MADPLTRTQGSGARPQGAADEAGAALAVRAMFDEIAPRYDLLNHVLSLNIDRLWWNRTARTLRPILLNPNAAILDICCGTGDMTMALLRHRPANARPILAADFAHQMLVRGAQKFTSATLAPERNPEARHDEPAHDELRPSEIKPGGWTPARVIPMEADALHLPIRSDSLDLITTAFGFRNLANYREGLAEFHRTLAPGGQLAILDFAEPGGVLGKLYAFYFRRILPLIGASLSGSRAPYTYLPSSVEKFPPPPAMLSLLRDVGFSDVSWTPYTFGIAGLYRATRK